MDLSVVSNLAFFVAILLLRFRFNNEIRNTEAFEIKAKVNAASEDTIHFNFSPFTLGTSKFI